MRELQGSGHRGHVLLAGLMSLGLLASACGSSGGGNSNDTTATSAGAATTAAGGATTVGTVAAPTTTAAEKPKPVSGGKIVIGVEAETSNPWTPSAMQCDAPCQLKIRTVYEPLVSVDNSGKAQPYLAESVKPNADFTVWTIKLRSGIVFHDGTPLNADAVIDNLNRMLNSFLVGAGLTYIKSDVVDGKKVGAFTKVDDLTVDVQMVKPWASFDVSILSGQVGFEASPKWLAAVDADPTQATKPVGTGPFVYDSYAPGSNFVVKKNPNYWRKDADGNALPYLDSVEFRVIPDSLTRSAGLESGDLDVIHTTDGESIKKFRAETDKFPLIEADNLGETSYVLLHVGQDGSPLQDQRVRCGLAAAYPQDDIIAAVQAGVNKKANGPFSPSQPGYLADTGYQSFDMAKAKELIAAYTAEKGAPPKIIYTVTNDQQSLTSGQIIQASWQEAGVTVEINQIEQGKLITNALTADDSFMAFQWRNHGGYLDNQFIWWHSSLALPKGQLALNFGRLKDPIIDKALEDNRNTNDQAASKALAESINKEFAKECWIIPDYWTLWGIPHSPAVQGLTDTTFPDDPTQVVAVGQGFPGSFMLTQAWLKR